MSTLGVKYYGLVKNHSLNFKDNLTNIKSQNNNIRNWCLQYDFINCDLKDKISDYPKFLTYSNLINYNTKKYNQNKIFNSTTMNIDQLNASIVDKSCYNLLNKIRKIPNNFDDLSKEYTFQNNYSLNFKDVYNKNLFIYNYLSDDYFSNFSSLLNDFYDVLLNKFQKNILDNQSFFHLYFLKSFTNDLFNKKCTLRNLLINNISNITIAPNITNIIDPILEQITSEITKVIITNQYNFIYQTDDFMNVLKQDSDIKEKVLNLAICFDNYLYKNANIFKEQFMINLFDHFNHSFSFSFTDKYFNSKNIFDFVALNQLSYQLYSASTLSDFENLRINSLNYSESLNEFERQIINFYETSLNNFHTIKQYFYMLYLNRGEFEKFINIIDLVASTYVFDSIRFDDVYFFNNFSHLDSLFKQWSQCFYFDNFKNIVSLAFNSNKYLTHLSRNTNLIKFAIIESVSSIIEQFLLSDDYENVILDLQKQVYKKLRATGNIEKNVDWCKCDFPIKVYVSALFKELIHDNDFCNIVTIYNYLQSNIELTTYSNFNDIDDFSNFVDSFRTQHSREMFTFYENFLKSITGSVFARAIHDIYAIKK